MSAIAIIPARGGSQRIPRKNLKPFKGVPMLVWSIRTAIESGVFERVMVSTDDAEIAEVALAHGADVPFVRPAELSDHHTGTSPVIRHALQAMAEQGMTFDFACCLYATAPLLRARYLRQGLQALEGAMDKSFAFSVCSFPFPVQRALCLDPEGGVVPMYPEFSGVRSQDLPEAYQDAGQFYWGRSQAWLAEEPMFSPRSLPVVLPRHLVQDIDTEEDWLRAEYLYAALLAGGELHG